MTRLGWGIMGTGNIAQQFATGVNASRRGRLAAVGSRTLESSRTFGTKFQVPKAHPSYQQLIDDPDVDAIYISLPNSMHHEWTIKALNAGKHVLCEKPFATNAEQSEEMFDVAKRQGKVLVEAFMYRSHPQTLAIEKMVREGAIGKLRAIRTSFCYRTSRTEGNIRFSSELAGGALMDIGCYCVNFSRYFAGGEPTKVVAYGQLHESGVDEVSAGTMQFASGVVATFVCGMRVQGDNTAFLCGEDGYLEIGWPWKPSAEGATFVLARNIPPRQDAANATVAPPKPRETFTVAVPGNLYGFEADDFAASVFDGKPPALTREDTLGNMRVLDEMRRQMGLPF